VRFVKFGFSATTSCSRSAWRNFSGGEIGVADVVTTSIGAKFLEQALKDLRHGSLLVPLARHCALGLMGFARSHSLGATSCCEDQEPIDVRQEDPLI
jgi:hypothetical protein